MLGSSMNVSMGLRDLDYLYISSSSIDWKCIYTRPHPPLTFF